MEYERKLEGIFLAIVAAIISGAAICISSQFLKTGIDPGLLTGVKNSAVALIFSAILFLTKDFSKLKELRFLQWLGLIAVGLIGGFAAFLLFFYGLQFSLTNGLFGVFCHKMMFVFILFLAHIFLKEKANLKTIGVAAIIFVGNLILLGPKELFDFNQGRLWILVAVFLWAIENVVSKRLLEDISSTILIWGRMFFGSIAFLIYLSAKGGLADLTGLHYSQAWKILLLVLILSGFIFAWYRAIERIELYLAAIILSLGFILSRVLFALFDQRFSLGHDAIGIILLIVFATLVLKGVFNGIKVAFKIEMESEDL